MSTEKLRRHHQAVTTIHEIVGAMRAIAAGRIQSAQKAMLAARRYHDVVVKTLHAVIDKLPADSLSQFEGSASTLILMTSEQPLCGRFNQDLLTFAEKQWKQLKEKETVFLIVIGQHGRKQLSARGMTADTVEAGATTSPGLRDLVKRLSTLVSRRYQMGQQGKLRVIYNRYQSVTESVPTIEQILPVQLPFVDRMPGEDSRNHYRYLSTPVLLAGLIREFAFINLYRAAADSYASEQATRLVAMDGATRNSEKMLEDLLNLERRERQGEITQQVLELISARFASFDEE